MFLNCHLLLLQESNPGSGEEEEEEGRNGHGISMYCLAPAAFINLKVGTLASPSPCTEKTDQLRHISLSLSSLTFAATASASLFRRWRTTFTPHTFNHATVVLKVAKVTRDCFIIFLV